MFQGFSSFFFLQAHKPPGLFSKVPVPAREEVSLPPFRLEPLKNLFLTVGCPCLRLDSKTEKLGRVANLHNAANCRVGLRFSATIEERLLANFPPPGSWGRIWELRNSGWSPIVRRKEGAKQKKPRVAPEVQASWPKREFPKERFQR